ncbi:MAG: (Fe-S)-binding protein [Anaerolineae bacterium]|nr:(Fe-S)-binding protein [Caldilineales bacterium]MDW8269844.1 (Fe-S)-binding protein [Anaerolineae bacterium]
MAGSALFASCTAQAFRPGLVRAAQRLGHDLGLAPVVPPQTCCGLPAWDAGQVEAARAAARRFVTVFAPYGTVLTLSPACRRMVCQHIPALLAGEPEAGAATALAERVWTWPTFLVERVGLERLELRFAGRIAYFPACTGEDETAMRAILGRIAGAEPTTDLPRRCCGYGLNLVWRHPELSRAMAEPVLLALRLSGAERVLTDEVGCLVHLLAQRRRGAVPVLQHLVEFLADPDCCRIRPEG